MDFPTIQVTAQLARRQSGDDGLVRGAAARTPVLADPRRRADDLHEFARTRPITVQFDLDRNIDGAANDIQAAINAAGGQLPKNLPSPPTYRKVNPADSPILLLSAISDSCR